MTDADQKCHKSWPEGDPDGWRSEFAACRTIPNSHLI